jgi:hypothetical protein
MDARAGDRIVLESGKVGTPTRQGKILKVTPHEIHDEFQVRWDDGHVSEIRPSGAAYRILAKGKGPKG